MKICSDCGEYKKVKKRWIDLKIVHSKNPIPGLDFDYICEDCDKALEIDFRNENERRLRIKKEKQKNWIKERDKILKEGNK